MALRGFNPRSRLQQQYDREAAAKKESERVQSTLKGVPVIGSGALSFADVDKWLADNPDAQYFRIGGGGNAAIVGSADDKKRPANQRYATNQREAQGNATISTSYSPSSWFKENKISYDTDPMQAVQSSGGGQRTGLVGFGAAIRQQQQYQEQFGLIYSRDEYGKLKESYAKKGKGDRFLEAATRKPELSSDYGKDKGTILTGVDTGATRRGALGSDDDEQMAGDDTKTKRKLLG
ncbi:MAG: hypothetical protein RBT70_08830 [Alphaproteobacteria bacterium]|jgi:hypothetical protein|nr:hypothetical protein [Alphaproteobacteria bacterium]